MPCSQVLLPPLTALELASSFTESTRVEGAILVIRLQPTINRNNRPIEEIVAKTRNAWQMLVRSMQVCHSPQFAAGWR